MNFVKVMLSYKCAGEKTMNEDLLHDYWKENGATYTDFTIDIQTVSGGVVIFRECGKEGWDFEQITIDVLDIISWVYSKQAH